MKITLIVSGMIVAALVLYRLLWGGAPEEGPASLKDALFTVKRGDLTITVVEDGYLKAKNSVKMQPKFRRQGIISWLIEEGSKVKEGDVLVEFEKTEVQTQMSDLENSLIQYETELEAVKAELAIQGRENTAFVEGAELDLQMSRMTLERFEKGEAPNELRKKNLAVEKTRSRFKRAEEQFQQVPELAKEGFFTKIQVEEERIKVEEARIDLENAEKELELYETYTFKMDLIQKEANLKDAERKLQNAREKSEINLKEKQARVTRQERQVASTKARLDKLKKEFEGMTMKAPSEGIVHYGDPSHPWRRDQIKVGNSVYSGNTVVTLPDLRDMQILVSVHEADIDLVKEEMKVAITVESAKGKTFTGKVTKIASVASSDGWDNNNKTFRIEITMESGDIELRAGISARAEIQVETIPDVFQVPIHAVISEGGEHFCYISAGEEMEKRIVKVGKNNNHFIHVLEGLEEGEKVLLYDPRESGVFSAEGVDEGDGDSAAPAPAENPAASE
jgi:HlyD family secretion protein